MTLTTNIFCMFCFVVVCFSLKCYDCDDPSDSSCKSPNVKTCSEEETLCYTLSYHMVGLEENWVLKGCTDNCEKTFSKRRRLISAHLQEDCCNETLCNKPGKYIKPATEKIPEEEKITKKENVSEKAVESEKREVLLEVETHNGSEWFPMNNSLLIVTFCVLLLIIH